MTSLLFVGYIVIARTVHSLWCTAQVELIFNGKQYIELGPRSVQQSNMEPILIAL